MELGGDTNLLCHPNNGNGNCRLNREYGLISYELKTRPLIICKPFAKHIRKYCKFNIHASHHHMIGHYVYNDIATQLAIWRLVFCMNYFWWWKPATHHSSNSLSLKYRYTQSCSPSLSVLSLALTNFKKHVLLPASMYAWVKFLNDVFKWIINCYMKTNFCLNKFTVKAYMLFMLKIIQSCQFYGASVKLYGIMNYPTTVTHAVNWNMYTVLGHACI